MSDSTNGSVDDDDASPEARPSEIAPDTKDWTWVLNRACPECGFVAGDVVPDALGPTIRELTPRWQAALARPDSRRRPRPETWSALEYGAHVRDVNRVFAERLRAMLELDYPMFANWDQDAAAFADRYDLQDPARVSAELAEAASLLAERFEAVIPEDLGRTGRRSNGSVFTVRTLGQYYLHDVVHHLHDVQG